MLEYRGLPPLLERVSSAVGRVIRLGKVFVEEGIQEMEEVIKPEVVDLLGHKAIPRVIPSYTILMWFTFEVCINLSEEVTHINCFSVLI